MPQAMTERQAAEEPAVSGPSPWDEAIRFWDARRRKLTEERAAAKAASEQDQ